jgi:hypothetical protein
MAMERKNQGREDEHGTPLYDALWRIWLAGYWSRPWAKLFYEVGPTVSASPVSLAKIEILDREFAILLSKIIILPPELIRIIVGYSLDSLLWRYALALAWPSGPFGNLRDGQAVTLSPNGLCRWHRGGSIQTCVHQHKYARFTLDGDGIKIVEFLDCRNVAPQSEDRDKWYIFEDFARINDFRLESKVNKPLSTKILLPKIQRVAFYVSSLRNYKTRALYGTPHLHLLGSHATLLDPMARFLNGYGLSHSINTSQA